MEYLGQPFSIQNTTGPNWLVTWDEAALITTASGEHIESVSFTVAIPRKATLTIVEIQDYALKRAVELLQSKIRGVAPKG